MDSFSSCSGKTNQFLLHFQKEVKGEVDVEIVFLFDKFFKLLQCPEDKLVKALLNKTIEARDDVVVSPMGRDEAVKARDALSKSVYERMFTWLVQRLNRSLQSAVEVKKKIVLGILDIYGFEIFQSNSFEQLCINYCNEKLQQLFIELTLKSEQDEYRREGIAFIF